MFSAHRSIFFFFFSLISSLEQVYDVMRRARAWPQQTARSRIGCNTNSQQRFILRVQPYLGSLAT